MLVIAMFFLERLMERVRPIAAERHRLVRKLTIVIFLMVLFTSALTYVSLYALYQPRFSCG
jgi:uncharacterized membrane protein YozB (DUF420 family)